MTNTSRSTGELAGSPRDELARLVADHHVALMRHAQLVHPRHDAQSIVNATFTIAWRRIGDVPEEHPRAWLKGVMRNVVLNTQRGENRWQAVQAEAARQPATREVAAPDDDRRLELRIALQALETLAAEDQAVLRMQLLEDPSSDDLARVLGVSVGAARNRLSRARQRLDDACKRVLATEGGGTR